MDLSRTQNSSVHNDSVGYDLGTIKNESVGEGSEQIGEVAHAIYRTPLEIILPTISDVLKLLLFIDISC